MNELIYIMLGDIYFTSSICLDDKVSMTYANSVIYICEQKDYSRSFPLIIHELGHHLYNKLADNEKVAVRVLFDMSTESGDYASSYAQKNEKEDFSETLKYMYIHGEEVRYNSAILNTKVALIRYVIYRLSKED